MFIIGEGMSFTVEDSTRLMHSLHKANVVAEQVDIRLYNEQKLQATGGKRKPHPRVTKVGEGAWSQSPDGAKVTGYNKPSAVLSTKARPIPHQGMA